MKKTAIFTIGTRGDVQPYIFLSRELIKNGYDVTLGSHPCWRGLIEEAGIHFAPIGPDIDIEKEAAIIQEVFIKYAQGYTVPEIVKSLMREDSDTRMVAYSIPSSYTSCYSTPSIAAWWNMTASSTAIFTRALSAKNYGRKCKSAMRTKATTSAQRKADSTSCPESYIARSAIKQWWGYRATADARSITTYLQPSPCATLHLHNETDSQRGNSRRRFQYRV